MTKTISIGSEICTISSDELRALCIANNWFTRGNNEEYSYLFNLNDGSATLREIAHFIFRHSDTKTEVEIYVVLANAQNSATPASPLESLAPTKATKPTKSAKSPAKVKQSPATAKSGKVETSLAPSIRAKAIKQLEVITADIRKETGNIASAYMRIGFNLWQVKNDKLYLAVTVDGKPLKNVYEYCETAFGFKKTSAHNFISVCEKFSTKDAKGQPTANIDPAFAMFGYTQLSEMLMLPDEKLADVTPDMSMRTIRDMKKPVQSTEQSDDTDEPTEKKRTVAYSGEVNEKTYDSILAKLEKLMGSRIQIIVEK